jgi:hypothetical protein
MSLHRARPPSAAHDHSEDDIHGVGLILEPSSLVVEGILRGSSASESKMVEVGDVLTAVDGIPVRSYELAKGKILGLTGTHVQLSFAKASSVGQRVVTLDLMRGPAAYIGLAREASHLEEENEHLKQQLADLIADSRRAQSSTLPPPAPAPPADGDAMICSLRSQLQTCMTQLQYKNNLIASLEEQLGNSRQGTAQSVHPSQGRDTSPSRRSLDRVAADMEASAHLLMRSREQGYSGEAVYV